MKNSVKKFLGFEAENDLMETMRHGNTTTSDARYLRKLANWFRDHLGEDSTRLRLLRIARTLNERKKYHWKGKYDMTLNGEFPEQGIKK